MPRRSSNRISSSVAHEPQYAQCLGGMDSVSRNLHSLRRHWKWAAFCQFFCIFFDLIAINDISIEDIESDFSRGTDVFLPRVMQRLLFTLSYDRKISAENWQNALRRQFDRRNPDANPLGSQSALPTAANSRFGSVVKEELDTLQGKDQGHKGDHGTYQPQAEDVEGQGVKEQPVNEEFRSDDLDNHKLITIDWCELSMDQKLDALHTLMEWQFQNPTRLRHIMKSEDEDATWRSEPIGYDREQNAYWLIGGNRLWIQRAPPKLPTRNRKRKVVSEKARDASKPSPTKRQRIEKSEKWQPTPAALISTPGRSRIAKEQAKLKLDAQAKALAEFNRQVALPSTNASARTSRSRQKRGSHSQTVHSFKSAGVRLSARLRGKQDDGWQPVPEEWLKPDKPSIRNFKTGLESDDESISDLTELSDDNDDDDDTEDFAKPEEVTTFNINDEQDEEANSHDVNQGRGEFIEWETICITLAEWEDFPERFAKSTHYTEKSFFKFLANVVVPQVVVELKAIDQKRRLEQALNHRKRSSRIATRENEKEAAKLAAQKKAEEQEKYGRSRRLEARLQREETERVKRERAREERRMKREKPHEDEDEDDEGTSSLKEGKKEPSPPGSEPAQQPKRKSSRQRPTKVPNAGPDDWELDCEVCGRKGKNLDDGTPMMSCGLCLKWHHIQCHNKRDRSLGRPKRDWDRIEFFCQRCFALRTNGVQRSNGVPHALQPPQPSTSYAQTSWQAQSSYYVKHQGQEPAEYTQSYLAPTSSLRSSYPAHANNHNANNMSFNHYQPQDRAFTNDINRTQVPHHSYYRVNGSWAPDAARYQAYPPQPAWSPNHQMPNVVDQQQRPYEVNNVQQTAYDNLAGREAYRQPSSAAPPVSYHRTPYPPYP